MAEFFIAGVVAKVGDLKPVGESTMCTLTIPEDVYLGDNEKRTEWHHITLWGRDAKNAHKYLRPGSVVSARCSVHYNQTDTQRFTNFNVKDITYHANYGVQKTESNEKKSRTKRPRNS